jgi:hypothetical protein
MPYRCAVIAAPAPAPPIDRSARRRAAAMVAVATLAVVAATVLVAFRLTGPPPPPLAAPVDPRYPDMGMAPLSSILVGQDDAGRVYLRFSATLVNVGSGPLLVTAHRDLPFADDWRVVQRIEDGTGGYSERPIGARLVYGGDGHDHWHIVGAEAHQLETLEGNIVGGLVKSGFCYFDNVDYRSTLPGAPSAAVHASTECGGRFDRDIAMGISVGWGDEYQWFLLDQTIEITGVPDGRYRLRAIADPADHIEESDETNNDTWTVVDLSTVGGVHQVDVVEQGPAG